MFNEEPCAVVESEQVIMCVAKVIDVKSAIPEQALCYWQENSPRRA
jgi:hypothetical protein